MQRFQGVRLVVAVALGASLLTACTVSVPGGLIGGALSTVLAIVLFALAGGSQAGCDDETSPTPDPEDAAIGPCLTADMFIPDMEIGPCLSALPPDEGVIGPCLGAPQEDMGPDARIGPCLEAPLEDMGVGPCLDTPFEDMGVPRDAEIGPCLSPPPPPQGDMGAVVPRRSSAALDREAILARVLPGLPADVAARLGSGRNSTENS